MNSTQVKGLVKVLAGAAILVLVGSKSKNA